MACLAGIAKRICEHGNPLAEASGPSGPRRSVRSSAALSRQPSSLSRRISETSSSGASGCGDAPGAEARQASGPGEAAEPCCATGACIAAVPGAPKLLPGAGGLNFGFIFCALCCGGRSLSLAALALQIVSRACPALGSAWIWCPVCLALLLAAVRTEAKKGTHAEAPGARAAPQQRASRQGWRSFSKASKANSRGAGGFESVEEVQRHLDATRPPTDAWELQEEGWRDASRPTAELFLKFVKGGGPRKMKVTIGVQTQDQVQNFPLLQASLGSSPGRSSEKVRGGAIPIFWAIGQWPLWFPFCESVELLSRPAADQAIWLVRFKIVMITVDAVLCCCLQDNLDKNGCVEVVMWSPANSKAGQDWLGITVPQNTAQFRAEFSAMRMSVQPTRPAQGQVRVQCELFDSIGLEWLSVLFWQTACTRVVPLIARMQAKFAGSAIDRFYNGAGASPDQRRLFQELGQRITDWREAEAEGARPPAEAGGDGGTPEDAGLGRRVAKPLRAGRFVGQTIPWKAASEEAFGHGSRPKWPARSTTTSF